MLLQLAAWYMLWFALSLILFIVGVVSRFLSNPGKEHWLAVKWILRHIRGISRVCLYFSNGKLVLDGYIDANMAGDIDYRKSTSGYLITFCRESSVLEIKIAKICFLIHYWSWINCNYWGKQRVIMDEEVSIRVGLKAREVCIILYN